jgi:hypothetical protein
MNAFIEAGGVSIPSKIGLESCEAIIEARLSSSVGSSEAFDITCYYKALICANVGKASSPLLALGDFISSSALLMSNWPADP